MRYSDYNIFFKKVPNHCINKPFINILLFGDSIDRYIIDDICKSEHKTEWAQNFTYKEGAQASAVCRSDTVTIGFLHIYGSAPTGPYLHNHGNTRDDPYADTELRLKHGLNQYISLFGFPDFIFFRAEFWDLIVFDDRRNGLDLESHFQKFIRDNNYAISIIRSISPTSILCTHTIPKPAWGLALFYNYENGLRLLSDLNNLLLFDFQQLLSSKQGDVGSFLRDQHHPTIAYSRSLGELLIYLLRQAACIRDHHLIKPDALTAKPSRLR